MPCEEDLKEVGREDLRCLIEGDIKTFYKVVPISLSIVYITNQLSCLGTALSHFIAIHEINEARMSPLTERQKEIIRKKTKEDPNKSDDEIAAELDFACPIRVIAALRRG